MKYLLAMAAMFLHTLHAQTATGLDLSGQWRCKLDPDDAGVAAHWENSAADFTGTIDLPGTTDLAGLGPDQATAGPHDFHLIRAHAHVGPAWYTRMITVPAPWAGKPAILALERVMWQSRVWIDGKEAGVPRDSLCVPHEHPLGVLRPGPHRLVVRVDNRMIHPIGDKGHAYGDEMQGRWNGIAGAITLRVAMPDDIGRVRVFPDSAARTVRVELGSSAGLIGRATVRLTDPAGNPVGAANVPANSSSPLVVTIPVAGEIAEWGEFARPLYRCDVAMQDGTGDPRVVFSGRFGFRTLGRSGRHITINGHPVFFRGNLECAAFPLTGHPPTDVESWREIWSVYREHNLNHARFHSWCPPRAAFEAADEAGIFLQVEAPIWMDHWMAKPNARPEMDTAGYPQGLGRNDRGNDVFARAEIDRILDTYGNHPSFVMFCVGNELGTSNFDVLGQWMKECKDRDPRHLYAASTARAITPHCDYNATHNIPGIGACRARFGPDSRWNYEDVYGKAPVPILAHETGQYPVYPLWSEIADYSGPLKNHRLALLAGEARANGIHDDAPLLRHASGMLNQLLNRDEIEGYLRTPSCSGFQLLGMQDFTGQGEAMVGWRDVFYRDKGVTNAADFRHWCAPTVPLLRLPARVFSTTDTVEVAAVLHHFGEHALPRAVLRWTLRCGGKELASGRLPARDVAAGSVTEFGDFRVPMTAVPAGSAVELAIAVDASNIMNVYPLWVFAPARSAPVPPDVRVAGDWDVAKSALAAGKRVVFLANHAGDKDNDSLAGWAPLYWSVPFFPGQGKRTLGLAVRSAHPVFDGFPTADWGDWQWQGICAGARGFDLTGLVPVGWRPMAQPVTDFHYNRLLGTIFEAAVGQGKLLVCGYDLGEARAARMPEVAALRQSLLAYASDTGFAPTWQAGIPVLDSLFTGRRAPLANLPDGFARADLYVRAAGKLADQEKNIPWDAKWDQVLTTGNRVAYTVEKSDGIWADTTGSAWHGKVLRVVVHPRAGVPAELRVRFDDWNQLGRRGTLHFNGKEFPIGAHDHGQWITIPMIREDTNSGRIVVEATASAGPNLMITDIALIPVE